MFTEWTVYRVNSYTGLTFYSVYRVNSLHGEHWTVYNRIFSAYSNMLWIHWILFLNFSFWIVSKSQIMGGFGKMFYNVPQSTLICRNALSFDFTASLIHFKKHLSLALVLKGLLAKFSKFFCVRDCNFLITVPLPS